MARHEHKGLTQTHYQILRILEDHPAGISLAQIRTVMGLAPDELTELSRRIRELRRYYVVEGHRQGREYLYTLKGERSEPVDAGAVDQTTRARILHLAGSRCQMCGRTVAEHGITLHIDHKIPQSWGGTSDDDNLWAICSTCNEGKRNFFATITDERIQRAMLHNSIHIRLGELLKAFYPEPVPKEYLAIVGHTHDDWEKRLRELRELGWEYHFEKHKEDNRTRVSFVLDHWEPWPEDPAAAIREAERQKGKRR